MAEREEQLGRESEIDLDTGVDVDRGGRIESSRSERETTTGDGRLRGAAGRVVSKQSLAVALVLSVLGSLVVGYLVPLPFGLDSIATLLGVFVAAFAHGATSSQRHYTEAALAGGMVSGGAALLGTLVLAALGIGLPVVVLGALGGLIAGAAGHYLGRDVRDGLTREI
jgi:Zn-dependent protease